jgi:hypothetical protein
VGVERAARAAARLNHPGIVSVYELAADEHEIYLVSELVRGRTLAELNKAGAVADRDVARIGVALCEALEHAHAHGVIHRDVKPGNVMVVAEPAAGAGFAKLADFGVAHVVSDNPLTLTGDVIGTLAYMAPEQAEGQRVGPASDVYSLALTLYEAWTGTNPIRSGGIAATARRLGQPLPSLADRRPDLPLELCDAIDDALEVEPERRPRTGELRAELERAERRLDDAGGLVEPATLRRVGLPTTETRHARAKPELSRPGLIARRAGAGALAAGIVLGVLETLGPDPTFSAPAAAGIAALAVALLPRVAWLAVAMALCGWLVAPDADRQGTALVLAAAALPIPFLLPRAGLLWSLPILAPLLGTVALAPMFIGVAALASTAWRRAGLAAAGFLWLALGEVLTGQDLLFGVSDGTLARHEWQRSISSAASDALGPLLSGPALAPIAIWAAFAVLLPLVVRGRWLAMDLLGAGLWAVALVVTLTAVGDMLAATTALSQPRGAVAGAIGAALIVVAARQMAPAPEELTPSNAESVSTA